MPVRSRRPKTAAVRYVNGTLEVYHNGSWIAAGGAQPYLVYTALLSQSGTNAPVATVLENTLGQNVVWTRDSTGSYWGSFTFSWNKATAFVGESFSGIVYQAITRDSNRVEVTTKYNGILEDDDLDHTPVEIRVYP